MNDCIRIGLLIVDIERVQAIELVKDYDEDESFIRFTMQDGTFLDSQEETNDMALSQFETLNSYIQERDVQR